MTYARRRWGSRSSLIAKNAAPIMPVLRHGYREAKRCLPYRGAIALVGLLLLAACGGAASTPTPGATVTPTTAATLAATSTSVSSPTATALPNTATPLPPTATSIQPTATALQPTATVATLTVPGTPASILYAADFATWFVGAENSPLPFGASFDPARGEYRLALTEAQRPYTYIRYAPEGRGFADFQLDIDVRYVAGPTTGNFGVVFRTQAQGASDRTNARFAFVVYPNGHYALNFISAEGTARAIAPYASTTAITSEGSTIHLTVICRGDTITLGINGQTIGTRPAPLVNAGAIGIVVGNPPNSTSPAGMEAAFSNLRVTALPAASAKHTSALRSLPVGSWPFARDTGVPGGR